MKLCCFLIMRRYIDKAYIGKSIKHLMFNIILEKKFTRMEKKSGIAKLDYSLLQKEPIEFENKTLLSKFGWRTKAVFLPLKKYDTF